MNLILAGTDAGLVALGGPAPRLEGAVVGLARHGRSLWALGGEGEIWRRAREGWDRVADLEGLRANCLLPVAEDAAYVGTSEAHLFRVRTQEGRAVVEHLRSFDRAPGRAYWYTPWGGPADVRSLSADAAGTLYANVHVGGVLRSDDDGERWVATGIDIHADVHQVLADTTHPGRVLAATAEGLAQSADAGETWTTTSEGLHAAYCRAVAITRRGVLISASLGHHGREAALYRLRLHGFERCTDGLPETFADNIDTHCLDAVGGNAALGTSDGDVYLSRDEGESWEQMAQGLAPVRCVLLAG